MDIERSNFATKGVAGAGLGLGVAGTALGLLNGGLGNLFGGNCGNTWNTGCGCSDDHMVNRYEASQSARIAELETEVKLRDANIYTDSKLNDFRNYVDNRFNGIDAALCQQNVVNTATASNLACLTNTVNQLMDLTKLVVPNSSVCPGWGDVTVTVTPATTTT